MFGRIKLYIISDKPIRYNTPVKDTRIYAFVASKKQCRQYVNQYLKMKNLTHFRNWCDAHGLNPMLESSWRRYCVLVISEQFRDFCVTSYSVNKHKVASLLRLSTGCIPVGCDFESEEERVSFIERNFTQEEIDEFDRLIDEAVAENENK